MKLVSFMVEDGFDVGEIIRFLNDNGIINNTVEVSNSVVKDISELTGVFSTQASVFCDYFCNGDKQRELQEFWGNKRRVVESLG